MERIPIKLIFNCSASIVPRLNDIVNVLLRKAIDFAIRSVRKRNALLMSNAFLKHVVYILNMIKIGRLCWPWQYINFLTRRAICELALCIRWKCWPIAPANRQTIGWRIVSRYYFDVRKWFGKTMSVLPPIIIPPHTITVAPRYV